MKADSKEIFFKIFEKVYNDSGYNNPYDFLLKIIDEADPYIKCESCPLIHCGKYNSHTCIGSILEALEKGDIQL